MGVQHESHIRRSNGSLPNGTHCNGAAAEVDECAPGSASLDRSNEALATEEPTHPFAMVLLAGALKPSMLRQQIDVPALALPMTANRVLLDLWLELIERTPGCHWLKILVSSQSDQQVVSQALVNRNPLPGGVQVEVLSDPTPWRGPAGLLRDVVHEADLHTESAVLVAEAACLPPPTLAPLLTCMAPPVDGVVGSSSQDEPAGLYVFKAGILSSISARGYHDIKEQLLPDLFARGIAVLPVRIVNEVLSIRSLESYLRAVEVALVSHETAMSRSVESFISPTAQVAEGCLIHDDVSIEDGAIVHRSIVLRGARIGGGAVISNSLIGCDVHVEPRRVVRSAVLTPRRRRPEREIATSGSVDEPSGLVKLRRLARSKP